MDHVVQAVHGLSVTHMFVVWPLKFQLAVLSFEITPFNDQSKGQDVVVTCRQTPDTPLSPLCLHVYNDTDSHLSDRITYTQHRTPKAISVKYGFEAQTVLYVLSTSLIIYGWINLPDNISNTPYILGYKRVSKKIYINQTKNRNTIHLKCPNKSLFIPVISPL